MEKIDFSSSTQQSIKRINRGRFTEADAKSVLIDLRAGSDGDLREVGDQVAHHLRDRGITWKSLTYQCAQAESLYASKNGIQPFTDTSTCEWWVRPLLEGQLTRMDPDQFKSETNCSLSEFKNILARLFPTKKSGSYDFQTLKDYHGIIQAAYNLLIVVPVLDEDRIRRQLTKIFGANGIDSSRFVIDAFIASILVIMNGAHYKIAENQSADLIIATNNFDGRGANTTLIGTTRYGPET